MIFDRVLDARCADRIFRSIEGDILNETLSKHKASSIPKTVLLFNKRKYETKIVLHSSSQSLSPRGELIRRRRGRAQILIPCSLFRIYFPFFVLLRTHVHTPQSTF